LAHCTKSGDQLATDKEIIDWANQKLKSSGKLSLVSSFQDPRLSDGKAVIDLIDAIQPNVIDYSLVQDGVTDVEKLANAKYAVTTARKIGAKVYALPEDIVEVKPKMLLTVFACLMARDYQPNVRERPIVSAPAPTPATKPMPPPVAAKPVKMPPVTNGSHQEATNDGHQEDTNGNHQEATNGSHQEATDDSHQEATNGGLQEDANGGQQEDANGVHQEDTNGGHQEDATGGHQEDATGGHQEDATGGHQEDTTSGHQEATNDSHEEDISGSSHQEKEQES